MDTNMDSKADMPDGPSGELAEMMNVAMERVAEQAITHPMRTLGIAAGVGYTLGGGLPKFVVRLGMIFGARMITNVLVSASLEQLGGPARGDDEVDARVVEGRNNGRFAKRSTNNQDRRRAAS